MKQFRVRLGSRADGFLRAVGVLVSGTAIAHGLTALALPIITRLYTPGDFNLLAVFTSMLGIVSVAACLRFDVAIPIPEHHDDAANVLGLAITSSVIISVGLAIGVSIGAAAFAGWLNRPDLSQYLWLLPLGVALAGSYSAMQFWFVRKKGFSSIAASRVLQSSTGAGTQIGLGWAGWAPAGLLLGQVVNSGAGCVGLGCRLVREERQLLKAITWARMAHMFAAYERFPKYSTLEALSNSAGIHLPVIMIAALAASPEAGFLVLATYVMQAPMSLIGTAIAQVYLSRAPDEFRAGRLGQFTSSVFGGLFKSGTGPLVFAGIVAPDLFALVFGEDWRRAGVLVTWMTPWFVMQFVSAPVATALHVTANQKTALWLQLSGLILRVAAVYCAALIGLAFISETYALSGFIFYLAYTVIVLRVVKAGRSDILRELRAGLPVVLGWSAGGCLLALAMYLASPVKS